MPVEIEAFGDDTYEMLGERVYPVYSKVSAEIVDALPSDGDVRKEMRDTALQKLNEALVAERMRKWDSRTPKLSDDPEVAELQKERDTPRPIAERIVKEHRRRVVAEMPSPSNKVQ